MTEDPINWDAARLSAALDRAIAQGHRLDFWGCSCKWTFETVEGGRAQWERHVADVRSSLLRPEEGTP